LKDPEDGKCSEEIKRVLQGAESVQQQRSVLPAKRLRLQ
jgi:hypothetical protein